MIRTQHVVLEVSYDEDLYDAPASWSWHLGIEPLRGTDEDIRVIASGPVMHLPARRDEEVGT